MKKTYQTPELHELGRVRDVVRGINGGADPVFVFDSLVRCTEDCIGFEG